VDSVPVWRSTLDRRPHDAGDPLVTGRQRPDVLTALGDPADQLVVTGWPTGVTQPFQHAHRGAFGLQLLSVAQLTNDLLRGVPLSTGHPARPPAPASGRSDSHTTRLNQRGSRQGTADCRSGEDIAAAAFGRAPTPLA